MMPNYCVCICVCTCLREIGLSPRTKWQHPHALKQIQLSMHTEREIDQCLRFECCNVDVCVFMYGYSMCFASVVLYNKANVDVPYRSRCVTFSTPNRQCFRLQCIMNTHRNELKCLSLSVLYCKHLYLDKFVKLLYTDSYGQLQWHMRTIKPSSSYLSM